MDGWEPPTWLEPHERDGAQRVRGSLQTFRGALLADAVGLGKTYVALAIAAAYPSAVVVVPAILKPQWMSVSASLRVKLIAMTHESLSRGAPVPAAELIVVDEAHRFRNASTKRYFQLAKSVRRAHLLLVTATPVVNQASDLTNLIRLFAGDNAFGVMGLHSLEEAVHRVQAAELAFGTAPCITARSMGSLQSDRLRIPAVKDYAVIRAPVVSEAMLRLILRAIDSLRFPTFGTSAEAALLRSHLYHRLASSACACVETVKRHLAYVRRAGEAAERGETLPRALARSLFAAEDELQLPLGDLVCRNRAKPISTGALETEKRKLRDLRTLLSNSNEETPKTRELERLLANRNGRKTVVFTTAVATALDLARRIGWRETAVVASGRAWIASGPIGIADVIDLFAPDAMGKTVPPTSRNVSTLIATDLVSEGLNLQDADSIVHYDLPWTPLRLEQRLGRIARLHSIHRDVSVQWFGVHPDLETRLRLEQRITEKAECQLGLGVISTSRVGRGRIINRDLEHREAIGRVAGEVCHPEARYAVVAGPLGAAVVVVWKQGSRMIPELMVIAGDPLRQVRNFASIRRILDNLLRSPKSDRPPPDTLIAELRTTVRQRLSKSNRGATNANAIGLARTIVRYGYAAGRERNTSLLRVLDAALDRVQQGLPIGAERTLHELLEQDPFVPALSDWLENQPPATSEFPSFRVAAALFGDGSKPGPSEL